MVNIISGTALINMVTKGLSSADLIKHVKVHMRSIPDGPSYIFQIQAYNKVIRKIQQLSFVTPQIIDDMDLTKYMKGVLKEFLKFKKVPQLDILDQLMDITGIGKKLAQRLIKDGVKTTSDLKKKKYMDMIPLAARIDIRYKPISPIPKYLIDYLHLNWSQRGLLKKGMIFVGSYRRQKSHSSDIDILVLDTLVTGQFLNKLDSKMIKIYPAYSKGPSKISTIIRLVKHHVNVKVDFFVANKEEFPFALLYATGSKDLNIKMRATAKRKGYLLNQHGLFKGTKKIKATTERDIFSKLNMVYVHPSKR